MREEAVVSQLEVEADSLVAKRKQHHKHQKVHRRVRKAHRGGHKTQLYEKMTERKLEIFKFID